MGRESTIRQGIHRVWQTSTSHLLVAPSATGGLNAYIARSSRTPQITTQNLSSQQVLSTTFSVLVPGFWHLDRIHVCQIRNSYFSTSATVSDSKSFWTSCLLFNLFPASTSSTATASTNTHPQLGSKCSHQVATHPISLKKCRANKLHLW